MYIDFYGLTTEPFRLSPDRQFCIHHPSFARARAYMKYALHRQEGFVVITGRPGTGKTTLIDDLVHEFSAGGHQVARLESARLEADDLLRMVCYAFGLVADGASKSDLLRRFSTHIGRGFMGDRRPLLIVDEAQGLSLCALEELRLLTNQLVNGRPLLQIFLVGQEELRDLLADPSLEQLRQRVVAACHLEPLKPDQTAEYVLHRLKTAGWRGNPRFESAIFPRLYAFTQGVPRLINQVCSRLLLHGSLEEKRDLGVDDIELVIRELRSEHLAVRDSDHIVDLSAFTHASLDALSNPAPATGGPPIGERLLHSGPAPGVPEEKVIEAVELELQNAGAAPPPAAAPVIPAEPAAGPPVSQGAAAPPAGPAVLPRRDLSPLWGLAATLAMAASVAALTLFYTPLHELERLAPAAVWQRLEMGRHLQAVAHRPADATAPGAKAEDQAGAPTAALPVTPKLCRVVRLQPGPQPAPGDGAVTVSEPAGEALSLGEEPAATEEGTSPAAPKPSPERKRVTPPAPADPVPVLENGRQGAEMAHAVSRQSSGMAEPAGGEGVRKVKEGTPEEQVTVSRVSFGFDSAVIEQGQRVTLDRVADVLKSSPASSARILGYTDSIGDLEYNEKLSWRRARAVAEYIREQGVPGAQLQVEGRGLETSPGGASAASKGGRSVEIILHRKPVPLAARLVSVGPD